jgi:DNA-binding transcriptional ArsR family regulator
MDDTELANRLEALGNETRLAIFRILVRAGNDGLPVGVVQERTGIPRSTLSHHLHKLISVGLVRQRREATTLYCSVQYDLMNQMLDALRSECCEDMAVHDHDVA